MSIRRIGSFDDVFGDILPIILGKNCSKSCTGCSRGTFQCFKKNNSVHVSN